MIQRYFRFEISILYCHCATVAGTAQARPEAQLASLLGDNGARA